MREHLANIRASSSKALHAILLGMKINAEEVAGNAWLEHVIIRQDKAKTTSPTCPLDAGAVPVLCPMALILRTTIVVGREDAMSTAWAV